METMVVDIFHVNKTTFAFHVEILQIDEDLHGQRNKNEQGDYFANQNTPSILLTN